MPSDTIVDIYCHIFPDKFFQEMNPIAPTIEAIKRLEISDSDRRKIFCGNAERLLKRQLS